MQTPLDLLSVARARLGFLALPTLFVVDRSSYPRGRRLGAWNDWLCSAPPACVDVVAAHLTTVVDA